jgi:hypothetical protein
MKTLAHWLAAWACLGMLIGPATQTFSADAAAAPKASAAAEPLDLSYIPAEAVAAAVVHPQTILAGPNADWLPLEVITAWGMKEVGIDPVKIKEVVAVIAAPQGGSEPHFGVVVRFSEAYSKADVVAKLPGANEIVIDGKTVLPLPGRGAPLVYFPDDHTIVLGSAPLMKSMIAAKDVDSAVTKLLKESDTSGLLTAVASLDDVRPQLREAMREGAARTAHVPPEIRDLSTLPDLLSAIVFQMSGSETMTVSLTLRGRDEASAQQAERIIKQGLDAARRMIVMQATADANQRAGDDAVQQAGAKYSARMVQGIFGQIKPARDGRDVRIAVESDSTVVVLGVFSVLAFVFQSGGHSSAARSTGPSPSRAQ